MRFVYSVFIFLISGTLLAEEPRPNFLFVAVDDLNHYTSFLSEEKGNFFSLIYPNERVRRRVAKRATPNLQRLADQSTVFTRAYCASPLCGPSRTALMTGVPTHVSGYYEHNVHFRRYESLADVVTLPQYLRSKGYFTTGLGKIYHTGRVSKERGDFPDTKYSWDRWVEVQTGVGGPGIERSNSKYSPNYDRLKFGPSNLSSDQTHDYRTAQFASQLLLSGEAEIEDLHGEVQSVKLPEDQPFFLAAGLFAPHLPWHPPAKFFDRFPTREMAIDSELEEWVRQDAEDLPDAGKVFLDHFFDGIIRHGNMVDGPGGGIEAWKASIQGYLATIAFADHCLGQLIDALEESEYGGNTVVVLWSDHGWQFGDKMRYRKHALWDAANRCVLIMRDPRISESAVGSRSDRIVSLQHLYPTITSLAGLETPSHVHGHDLTPLLQDPAGPFDETIIHTYLEGNHTIRTSEYRYIRYNDNSEELYFWKEDPFEYVNRAALDPGQDKKGQEVLKAMRVVMNEYLGRDAAFYRN